MTSSPYASGRPAGDLPENPSAAQLLEPESNLEVEPASADFLRSPNGPPLESGPDVRDAWVDFHNGLGRLGGKQEQAEQLRGAIDAFEVQHGPGATAEALYNRPEAVFASVPGGKELVAGADAGELKGAAQDYFRFKATAAQEAIRGGGEEGAALGRMDRFMGEVFDGAYEDGAGASRRLAALERQGHSPEEIGAAIKKDPGVLGEPRSGMDAERARELLGDGTRAYLEASNGVAPELRQAVKDQSGLGQAAENNPGLVPTPDPGNGLDLGGAAKGLGPTEQDVLNIARNPYMAYQI